MTTELINTFAVAELMGWKPRNNSRAAAMLYAYRRQNSTFPAPTVPSFGRVPAAYDKAQILSWLSTYRPGLVDNALMTATDAAKTIGISLLTLMKNVRGVYPSPVNDPIRGRRHWYRRSEIDAFIDTDRVSLVEASRRLGLSRERMRQLSGVPGFPEPAAPHVYHKVAKGVHSKWSFSVLQAWYIARINGRTRGLRWAKTGDPEW